jgi:hypothetical protein
LRSWASPSGAGRSPRSTSSPTRRACAASTWRSSTTNGDRALTAHLAVGCWLAPRLFAPVSNSTYQNHPPCQRRLGPLACPTAPVSWGGNVRAHYYTLYGRPRPAKTQGLHSGERVIADKDEVGGSTPPRPTIRPPTSGNAAQPLGLSRFQLISNQSTGVGTFEQPHGSLTSGFAGQSGSLPGRPSPLHSGRTAHYFAC